ncbi:MAG: response regulator [Chloroflexi bacterium]|nr:response regulator [Chloroflexota bacterium]
MADSLTWMVVEDDHAIRDVINTMCELWDFTVYSFKDGFEAMAFLQKEELENPLPDIALIDIRMPGAWGHEISAAIREHSVLSDIGIILMTAYALPGSDEEDYLRTSGADRLIYKPLPPMDDLRELVYDVLKERQAHT